MTAPTAARLAWSSLTLTILLAVADAVFVLAEHSSAIAPNPLARGFPALTLAVITGATIGALIASRHPRHSSGWIFCALYLVLAMGVWLADYADLALSSGGQLAGGHATAWLANLVGIMPVFYLLSLLFLRFPDGRLPASRWRLLGLLGALTLVAFTVSEAVVTWPPGTAVLDTGKGPSGQTAAFTTVRSLAVALAVAVLAGAAGAMLARLRRARGDERQQLKWLAFAAALVAGTVAVAIAWRALLPGSPPWWGWLIGNAVYLAVTAVPVAAGVAIFRYRLYDIDVIINRAVVLAVLGGFITGGYVAIVVGLGSHIGRQGNMNIALSLAAIGIVALAVQPAKRWAQRLADRLVYGERATPYQAMASFSNHLAGALSLEEVLPRMAEAAARGVGASRGQVRLFLPHGDDTAVVWPPGTVEQAFDHSVTVLHGREPVGKIAVAMPPGTPFTRASAGLLADLTAQAGVAMRNVQLTVELQRRLEELSRQSVELEASRQRLIAARDREQRRLEREIRAGPDAQLSAIVGKLQQAQGAIAREPERVAGLLDELDQDSAYALTTLRDIARGVFPRLLADKGVWVALGAHLRKLDAPVRLDGPPALATARFAPQVEAAVYFCCVEALHGAASRTLKAHTVVRLEALDGWVAFSVTSQPRRLEPQATQNLGLQQMIDRVEALGGTLLVRSGPCRVEGRIPLQPPATLTADQSAVAAAQAAARRSGRNADFGT
jgi:signal transduction histidine kinase